MLENLNQNSHWDMFNRRIVKLCLINIELTMDLQ